MASEAEGRFSISDHFDHSPKFDRFDYIRVSMEFLRTRISAFDFFSVPKHDDITSFFDNIDNGVALEPIQILLTSTSRSH
jgi:hypothetical protein